MYSSCSETNSFSSSLKINSIKHLWPFSKSKFNLKFNRINLVSPASPIWVPALFTQCLDDKVQTGTGKVDLLGNSNVLRLPVLWLPFFMFNWILKILNWVWHSSYYFTVFWVSFLWPNVDKKCINSLLLLLFSAIQFSS